MANSYIPGRDAAALQWMQAFAGGIGASPATYMLTASDASAINDVVSDYASALATATDPSTRT